MTHGQWPKLLKLLKAVAWRGVFVGEASRMRRHFALVAFAAELLGTVSAQMRKNWLVDAGGPVGMGERAIRIVLVVHHSDSTKVC